MEMEKLLKEFYEVVIEESKANEEFSRKLKKVFLDNLSVEKKESKPKKKKNTLVEKDILINPYDVLLEGKEVLENRLKKLELIDLKNIINYYAMDPSKAFQRWRKKERFIELILEVSNLRLNKGNAFR